MSTVQNAKKNGRPFGLGYSLDDFRLFWTTSSERNLSHFSRQSMSRLHWSESGPFFSNHKDHVFFRPPFFWGPLGVQKNNQSAFLFLSSWCAKTNRWGGQPHTWIFSGPFKGCGLEVVKSVNRSEAAYGAWALVRLWKLRIFSRCFHLETVGHG